MKQKIERDTGEGIRLIGMKPVTSVLQADHVRKRKEGPNPWQIALGKIVTLATPDEKHIAVKGIPAVDRADDTRIPVPDGWQVDAPSIGLSFPLQVLHQELSDRG